MQARASFGGQTAQSSAITVSTPPTANPPASLTAALENGLNARLSFSRSAVTGDSTSGFKLTYKDEVITDCADVDGSVNLSSPSMTTYLFEGLTADTEYHFGICAFNSAGTPLSSPATTSLTTAPAAPTGLSATVNSASQITLNWTDASASNASYELVFTGGGGGTISGLAGTDTSYVHSGLSASTAYSYSLRAVSSAGSSAAATASATTHASPPPDPSGLAVLSKTVSSITLGWSSGGGSTSGYKLAYQSGASAPANCASGTVVNLGMVVSTTVSSLTANESYSFRLCAVNSNPTPDLSAGVTHLNEAVTQQPPAAPSGLTAVAASTSQINLSWTDNSSAPLAETDFELEQSTDQTNWSATSGNPVANATTASAGSLSAGTLYYFRLRAVGSGGNSSYATTSGTTWSSAPSNPTNFVLDSKTVSSITLDWTSAGAPTTGFKLAYQTGTSAPANCASGTVVNLGNVATTEVTGLAKNQTYSFRLCALNSNPTPDVSTGVTLTSQVVELQAPDDVTDLAAVADGSDTINLSWSPVLGASSYSIWRHTNNTDAIGSWTQLTANESSTSYASTGLSESTTYYYRIKANNSAGGSAGYDEATASTETAGSAYVIRGNTSNSTKSTIDGVAQNGICASGLCTSGSPYTIPDNVSISDLELRNGAHVIIPAGITGTTIGNVSLDNSSSLTINKEFPFTGNFSVNSGTVTASAFSGTWNTVPNPDVWEPLPGVGNGKLVFTVGGTLSVGASGTISMDGKGYQGATSYARQGRSVLGPGIFSQNANGGGGGAADEYCDDSGCNKGGGGGGGYGSAGSSGSDARPGSGGQVVGTPEDFASNLYLGNGGGSCYVYNSSGSGGAGGGAIKITAQAIQNAGTISSKGISGSNSGQGCAGGSGSGGTIYLTAQSTFQNTNVISVAGGAAVYNGGAGGSGRMQIDNLADLALADPSGGAEFVIRGNQSGNTTPSSVNGFAEYDFCDTGLCTSSSKHTLASNRGTIGILDLRKGAYVVIPSDLTGTTINQVLIDESSVLEINKDMTFTSMTLTSGTITGSAYSSGTAAVGNGRLIFTVTGTLSVGASGVISMDGKGYQGGVANKQGRSVLGLGTFSQNPNGGGGGAASEYCDDGGCNQGGGGGGGYGSAGGSGSDAYPGYGGQVVGTPEDFASNLYLGNGGGSCYVNGGNGGAGGGAVKITAQIIQNAGTISSKGVSGIYPGWGCAGGSGSGGTIYLTAQTSFQNTNVISVAGGAAVNDGGAGGSGRLQIDNLADLALADPSGGAQFVIRGNQSGNTTPSSVNGFARYNFCVTGLCSSSSKHTLPSNRGTIGTLDLRKGAYVVIPATLTGTTINEVIVDESSTLEINKDMTFTSITLTSGTITGSAYSSGTPDVGNGRLVFTVGTISIAAAGSISMDGKGYPGGTGYQRQGQSPSGVGTTSRNANGGGGGGASTYCDDSGCSSGGGGGGGYSTAGSSGADGDPGAGGGTYSAGSPVAMGSGGGSCYNASSLGGAGGGVIQITATSLTSAGSISSRGTQGNTTTCSGGSGSGGAVYIQASTYSNTGSLSVAGGATLGNGGAGGTGRTQIN